MRPRRLECLAQVRRNDDLFRRDNVDAMGERGPAELGVQQRHGAADGSDAEPDRHVIRAVLHQQRDSVALGDALVERPARVTVGTRGQLREG